MSTSKTPRKRQIQDENIAPVSSPSHSRHHATPSRLSSSTNSTFVFIDGFTPVPKKRKVAVAFTADQITNLRQGRARQDRDDMERRRKDQEELARADEEKRLDDALVGIKKAGYETLYEFQLAMLTTRNPTRSSQVSRMLMTHGHTLFTAMATRQPEIAHDWMISSLRQRIAIEAKSLAEYFRAEHHTPVSDVLSQFSIEQVLVDANAIAPSTCDVLRHVGYPDPLANEKTNKHRALIIATTLCMLAKARNDHASQFQTSMCMYFLACGVSRSIFNVLNHAGITLSYSQAVAKLKQLGTERLAETLTLCRRQPFLLIWDNLNIPFRVGEQRQDSKDHFDNGTTATLVPVYGVKLGELSLDLKPKRNNRRPILDFTSADLLPDLETAQRVESNQLWHIQDIFYEVYPDLRARLKSSIEESPTVHLIPLHQTEQYPLPAMHIDESTLEGTLGVFDYIIRNTLKLSSEDISKHGLIICAGDQLTLSLLDKASASRRDDRELLDNIGRYTEDQDGLFHMKMAAARSVANEYWGQPNSPSPWSLWRMNALLARKSISAGWKVKSPPPFRPVWELMLALILPSNIVDGFRLFCGQDSLDSWIASVRTASEVKAVAERVLRELCSGRHIARLRLAPAAKRDMPFENICLFNRDCLYLRQFKFAVRQGDVGVILDIITHWMLMFRGTGQTPKYADALFRIVMRLKVMNPTLRKAWLENWLANLSGRINGFKEMDLLQEHQNFWAKIIYLAKGSNRTWSWLSMVSVSIFALRDVIRKVQAEFETPFNSKSHTTPSTDADIRVVCDYLKAQKIQTYFPGRKDNDRAVEARDLLACGSEYVNKPSAFRNFKYTKVKTCNHGLPDDSKAPVFVDSACMGGESDDDDSDGDNSRHDMGYNGRDSMLSQEDIEMDEDEYPVGTDLNAYMEMAKDIADELSHYEVSFLYY